MKREDQVHRHKLRRLAKRRSVLALKRGKRTGNGELLYKGAHTKGVH